MPKRTTLEAKRQFLFVLGFSLLIPAGLFSQSPPETVAQIASKAGIAQEPFPHLQGTSSLTLPTGVPLPPEMTYPQQGSIFAVQLREENAYWQHQIALTPGLREKLWQPDFASLRAYRKSLEAHRCNLRKILGLIELRPEAMKAETVALASEPVRIEDVTLTLDGDFQARALLFVPRAALCEVFTLSKTRCDGVEPPLW
jgi:hypothetical protein